MTILWDTERAGNPFLTWEWASTWWHHFGAGRKLRATACRAPDGEVRAILPLYEAAVRPVRVLRLMGHGPGDHLGLLCSPDDREDAGSALRELLSVDPRPWDVLLAERLPSDEGWAAAVGGEVLVRESTPTVRLDGERLLPGRVAFVAIKRPVRRRQRICLDG